MRFELIKLVVLKYHWEKFEIKILGLNTFVPEQRNESVCGTKILAPQILTTSISCPSLLSPLKVTIFFLLNNIIFLVLFNAEFHGYKYTEGQY